MRQSTKTTTHRRTLLSRVLLATLLATTAACSDGDEGLIRSLEEAGVGQYLGRSLPAPMPNGAWEEYVFDVTDDGPKCLFGTPYRVFLRPGSTDKVLFYLEGGGACWNEATCLGETDLGAKETSEPIADLAIFGGVLSSSPNNPLSTWNVLYVPYCDGSVFSGDNVVDYRGTTVHHRGQVNLSAAVDIMRDRYPNASEIMVSGSSAGGFGTFSGYGVVRVAYPETPLLILNDSGPGLQNNGDQQAIGERRENWGHEEFIVDACTKCGEQPAFLTDWALDNDPALRAALFSYQRDFVISDFLGLSRDDYRSLLLNVSGEINDRHPERFKRFLIGGVSHTILLGAGVAPGFEVGLEGTYNSLAIDGTGLPTWVAEFITDGPGWRDLVEGQID